jgi:hypothetical protein
MLKGDDVVFDGDFFLHISSTRKQLWQWVKLVDGGHKWRETALNTKHVFDNGACFILVVTRRCESLSAVKPNTYRRHYEDRV